MSPSFYAILPIISGLVFGFVATMYLRIRSRRQLARRVRIHTNSFGEYRND